MIIPTYNRYPFVCRAIESVLAQTYGHVECIVVDDASTDGTSDLLTERYGDNITIYRNEQNREKSFSRNAGILASTADYLAFLDSDDTLTPDSVEMRMAIFSEDPTFAGVSFGLRLGAQDDISIVASYLSKLPRGGRLTFEQYLDHHKWLSTNSYLIGRQAMLSHGMYNEELTNGEDIELFLRLMSTLEFRCCGTVVTRIFRDASNRARDNAKKIIEKGLVISRILEGNQGIAQKFDFVIRHMKKKEYAQLLRAYYQAKLYQNYRSMFSEGLHNDLSPRTPKFWRRYYYSWLMSLLSKR